MSNKIDNNYFRALIDKIKESPSTLTKHQLNQLKITLGKEFGINRIVKDSEILSNTKDNQERELLSKILNIKPTRELAGVTVIALFAKPHSCPHGKCIYCPGGPDSSFGDTPQSYTGEEPAALRAIRNEYDPYMQVFNRLEHYVVNGRLPDKIELVFMGGTFPSLDRSYRDDFTRYVYKAVNDFGDMFVNIDNQTGEKKIDYEKFEEFFETKESLDSVDRAKRIKERILELKKNSPQPLEWEISKNETAKLRCIGLTIETKPDWAFEEHCNEMLRYGTTRIEVGVQTLDELCLKKTNRGHTLEDTKKSFQVMKDLALKINAHMMLGLPSSTVEKDINSIRDLFELEDYRPDMLKIYPCLVIQGTPLYKLYEKGSFRPIDTKEAAEAIAESFKYIPRYVRVMRVQRDVPTPLIERGIRKSNLREYVNEEMKRRDIHSKDIRAREVGQKQLKGEKISEFDINVESYMSAGGREFFIEAIDSNDTLLGFIRLRFPNKTGIRSEITSQVALIRELHVYGVMTYVGGEYENAQQHRGWGRKLLEKAEEIARENNYQEMAIISGVGVREYYKNLGYSLEGVYMKKKL